MQLVFLVKVLQKSNVNVCVLGRGCRALMWLGDQGYWIQGNPVIVTPILIESPSEIGMS